MSAAALLAVSGVFVAVALIAGSATSWWLARSAPERKRLRNLRKALAVTVVLGPHRLTEGPDPARARWTRLIARSPKDMARLQRRLARAGFPDFEATVNYALAELLLPVLVGGAVLLLLGVSHGWLYAVIAGAISSRLPSAYVNRKTAERQKAMRNGLPDALDLLTICVDAGSGLEQSIARASDELQYVYPALAQEMMLVTTETQAGKPRVEALKNFARRADVEDVRALVNMLTQTIRFGTSVAEALRNHAETSRTKRRQLAEERAARVSVKLAFPLALCLFPALCIICFGPIIVALYRAFMAGVL